MEKENCIAVIIPSYKVKEFILPLIDRVPAIVQKIYCVDDACPEQSGKFIEENCDDPRVTVLYHPENLGVGGAMKTGYCRAYKDKCDIAVKLDGDGQMDPKLIPQFVKPIVDGHCDYTKGNRFYFIEGIQSMPTIRVLGNAVLSFWAKLSTGYWHIFDPTNGYTALHLGVADQIALHKVSNRFFFETDMLFRLNTGRCVVKDIPMAAVYGDEASNLKIPKIIFPFMWGHFRNTFKRIFYNYFLRDFHVASVEFIFGPILLLSGLLFGSYHWWLSFATGIPATSGTVMLSALQIILGVQLTLSAVNFDITNTPADPVHPYLPDKPRWPRNFYQSLDKK